MCWVNFACSAWQTLAPGTCPEHSTVYNVRTGKPLRGPGEIPLNTYEVQLDRGEIRVAVMADAERHFWHDPGNKERP